jgi:hypothetical protein
MTHTSNFICTFTHHLIHCNDFITRVIQKISSICKYCCCSAAVTMVRMHTDFVDSVSRHGRNLQTFEQCLCIVLCVYNIYENREYPHI